MTVGLPGTGIGGIFYLVSVFVIFVKEQTEKFLKKKYHKKTGFIHKQFLMALGIVFSLWLMSWFLGVIFQKTSGPVRDAAQLLPTRQTPFISLGIALFVLLIGEIAAFFMRKK